MNNNTNTNNTTYRSRRNSTVKTVVICILLVIIAIMATTMFHSCNNGAIILPSASSDTTTDKVNTSLDVIPSDCNCDSAGVIVNNNCACGTSDNTALFDKIDLLEAENASLKAENDTLRNGASADDKELANAKAEVATWKSKYQTLEKTHNGCTTVDLSKYVLRSEYDILVGMYNELVKEHNACGTGTIDLSKYVLKTTYNVALDKISKLEAEIASLKNHQCPTADHSDCKAQIAKLEKQIANHSCPTADHSDCKAQISKLEAEIASLKNHKCPTADHSDCKAQISKLEAEIAALKNHKCPTADHSSCERKYEALLDEFNSFKADHRNCQTVGDYVAGGTIGGGQTEGDYDADVDNDETPTWGEVWIDENGNVINP